MSYKDYIGHITNRSEISIALMYIFDMSSSSRENQIIYITYLHVCLFLLNLSSLHILLSFMICKLFSLDNVSHTTHQLDQGCLI